MKEETKKKLSNPNWRLVGAMAMVFIVIALWQSLFAPPTDKWVTIGYSAFLDQVESDNVASVTISGQSVTGEFKTETQIPVSWQKEPVAAKSFRTYLPQFGGEGVLEALKAKNVKVTVEPSQEQSVFWRILGWVLPLAIIILFWIFLMRRMNRQMGGGPGGLFTFGQSKAKAYDITKPRATFKDVAGMDNVKKELGEVIDFLKDPQRFKKIGAKVPKGVLLMGPPGTGKTLLARAVAGEAGVPFFSISASEFIEMFVGVGASRVRDMFNKAKASKPSIIFIDEIDAVGRTRGAGLGGGHDEREQTLNQLLSELDGFEPNEEIIVIAATNRPDVLDAALLRPGRFDRRLTVDRPGWKERAKILEIHIRNKRLAEGIDLESIAKGTPGMTGADLENLANEAALIAVRNGKERVEMSDFDEAKDKILMGTVREETISDLEKRITAYHEAGHALVAWKLPGTDPIHKVTILPRGMAMGVTQLLPEEDRHFYPRSYLVNRLTVALGGRGAEKLIFGDVSTGAQSDLKEATSLAEKMVAQWGMSDKVGPMSFPRGEEHPFLGRELAAPKHYSDEMAWMLDQEIKQFMVEAEKKAAEILQENRDDLEKLAQTLIKEESLDRAGIERILGKPAPKVPQENK